MQTDDVLPRPLARRRTVGAWGDFQGILSGGVLVAIAFGLEVQGGLLGVLRLVLGLIYVLYVPGYCLVAAIFPHSEDLDTAARVGVSVGLSVVSIPLLVLLLDQLPWGIRPIPILVSEFGIILLCMLIALWRRTRQIDLGSPRFWVLGFGFWIGPPSVYNPKSKIVRSWLLPAAATGCVLLLAGLGALLLQPGAAPPATEFYMLGSTGQAQAYPQAAAANEVLTVTLGLVNHEPAVRRYHVEVWAVDSQGAGGRTLVAQQGPRALDAGRRIEWPLAWRLAAAGPNEEVDFLLFMDQDAQPYRQLRLWLNPAALPPGNG